MDALVERCAHVVSRQMAGQLSNFSCLPDQCAVHDNLKGERAEYMDCDWAVGGDDMIVVQMEAPRFRGNVPTDHEQSKVIRGNISLASGLILPKMNMDITPDQQPSNSPMSRWKRRSSPHVQKEAAVARNTIGILRQLGSVSPERTAARLRACSNSSTSEALLAQVAGFVSQPPPASNQAKPAPFEKDNDLEVARPQSFNASEEAERQLANAIVCEEEKIGKPQASVGRSRSAAPFSIRGAALTSDVLASVAGRCRMATAAGNGDEMDALHRNDLHKKCWMDADGDAMEDLAEEIFLAPPPKSERRRASSVPPRSLPLLDSRRDMKIKKLQFEEKDIERISSGRLETTRRSKGSDLQWALLPGSPLPKKRVKPPDMAAAAARQMAEEVAAYR